MTFTTGELFQDKIRPFSEEFNSAMRGIASDLSELNRLMPLVKDATLRNNTSGGLGGTSSFPAIITGEAQIVGGRFFYELIEVGCLEKASSDLTPGSRSGSALNIAEYTGPEGYKGTGLAPECLQAIQAGGSTVSVLSLVGNVVMASEYEPVVCEEPVLGDPTREIPNFVFHCWVPYCIACGNGLPSEGQVLRTQTQMSGPHSAAPMSDASGMPSRRNY